jgi:hypothetical protein
MKFFYKKIFYQLWISSVDKDCPRVLINMEPAGNSSSIWDLVNNNNLILFNVISFL